MRLVRPRPGYADVMTTLALVLFIGSGAAYAAAHLGKNSVGTKQLKKNSVTTAKIKKNAVTTAKIRDGAVNGAKIADASLTGADIDAASVPFARVTNRLRNTNAIGSIASGMVIPLGTYTQAAGEAEELLGTAQVSFSASCAPPRVVAFLLLDNAANPAAPKQADLIGIGVAVDEHTGAGTATAEFGPPSGFGGGTLGFAAPPGPAGHNLNLLVQTLNCSAGSGWGFSSAGIDVVGIR